VSRIAINMDKAREVRRNQIRAARAPLFTPLDIAYTRAVEAAELARLTNDAAKLAEAQSAMLEIVAHKEVLRNAPQGPAIEAADTPEALKAVWPLPAA
jgi:hypothetical protein